MTMKRATCAALALAGALLAAWPSAAPAQPDPRQMSGIPLPDPQLSPGIVTVRVVRGTLDNNVTNHPVEIRAGDIAETVLTDEEGRAEFVMLNAGETVIASTELDGERIESQPFAAPGAGGVRLMLVGAGDAAATDVPPEPGEVSFGADSRIVVELGEESLSIFYLLDIFNPLLAPVEPPTPVAFALPFGAQGATVLRESAASTRIDGPNVTMDGPFAPGLTPLRVAYVLPYVGPAAAVSQTLPADLDGLLMVVQKWGAMELASDQIARRADMSPEGTDETYIFAAGPPVPGGTPITFEISGLPHHSQMPGFVTVALALGILGIGAWAAATPAAVEGADRRRRLEQRREKRFADLVNLEQQHRSGKVGPTRYGNRRAELLSDLERIYADLDDALTPSTWPHPTPPATGRARSTSTA